MTIKLLIADDNARVRESLVRLLAGDGIDVLEADTCRQAISLASRPDVDAVLLDINMPDGSGLEALAAIKQNCPDLPVIMHSEHDRSSYASRARQRGAAAYLVKGVDKVELLEAIDEAIRRAREVSLP
ncbi:MAG: response regulator [Planctomycetota bacterium]|nr:MAG: response regulator [Planctomycetota bacterium]REJ92153.1 MAG: response regulator [Planctomycetota bacterium]REK28689.1 MAG: response regulator [Planctomycetota bacterium]REK39303.1 MAG: response regulator [Planctomycetota bacterium]